MRRKELRRACVRVVRGEEAYKRRKGGYGGGWGDFREGGRGDLHSLLSKIGVIRKGRRRAHL